MQNKILITLFMVVALLLNGCATAPQQQAEINLIELNRKAEQAYKKKDWKQAEKYYRQLIAETPKDALLWFKLGNIFARTQRPEQAIKAYEEAVVRDSAYVKAWRNLGIVSLKKAAHLYIEMLKYIPENTETYYVVRKTGKVLLKLIDKNISLARKNASVQTGAAQ